MSGMTTGKPLRRRRRIAVVGTYRSGKTVFLTSLLNHLQYHDPDKFRIGNGTDAVIRKYKAHAVPHDVAAFRYEAYRDALVNHGSWPEKTCDSAHFICSFERSDWKWQDLELHFFDFPGERIADAAIAAIDNYEDWSDHLINYIDSQKDYRELAGEFLGLVMGGKSAAIAETEILAAYKLALANFIFAYKPMVSPSVFLLDANGNQAGGATAEEVANARKSGLAHDPNDPEAGEFAPLPANARIENSELTAIFAERYRAYRKRVVLPVFGHLKRCHCLVVLTDVTTILAGGTGMFNDNIKIIEDLFDVVRSRGAFGRLLDDVLSLFGQMFGGLDRVAFVAPKLDLVADADRDRLRGLLQQMHRHVARDLDVPHDWFTCSAIVSTVPARVGGHKLVGKLVWDSATGKKLPPSAPEREFGVPELPDSWPERWEKESIVFPTVYPKWPANRVQAPNHLNMDRIFDFLVG